MASRRPKLFCNTSVSSLQWALVSTLFPHTHFRAFLAVMADVIKQINTTIPALKTVSFRQDSTGCHHCRACRATIVCAGVLGAELGVVFKLLAPFPPWEPATARPAETKWDTFVLLNSGHDIKIPVENHP